MIFQISLLVRILQKNLNPNFNENVYKSASFDLPSKPFIYFDDFPLGFNKLIRIFASS